MQKLFLVPGLALVMTLFAPVANADESVTVGPATVDTKESRCPTENVSYDVDEEVPDDIPGVGGQFQGGETDSGFWTPAGASCRMRLEDATQVRAAMGSAVAVPTADGKLTTTVALTVTDNNSGEVLGSCARTYVRDMPDSEWDVILMLVLGFGSCSVNVTLDAPTDLDVTVTAVGQGAGRFNGRLD